MGNDVRIEMCRAVFTAPGSKWYLLEHGTILSLQDIPEVTDQYVIESMNRLATALGPYNGEGSPFGDCNPMQLRKFPGWLVSFGRPCRGMVTHVGPVEMENVPGDTYSPTEMMSVGDGKIVPAKRAPFEMRVALFGRYKRNLDARSPKIVARSTDA